MINQNDGGDRRPRPPPNGIGKHIPHKRTLRPVHNATPHTAIRQLCIITSPSEMEC